VLESAKSITLSHYVQLIRDTNEQTADRSTLHSTHFGPFIYTDKDQFYKYTFKDIKENTAAHPKSATDGWIGFTQPYFHVSWLPPEKVSREYFSRNIDINVHGFGAITSLGKIAPGASHTVVSKLLIGPQDQRMQESLKLGANLTRADLSRSNLNRSNLSRANLSEANLTKADLTRVNLTDAKVTRTNFEGAKLDSAIGFKRF